MKYTNTISNFDDLFSPSVNQNNLSSLQPDFATSNIQSLIQFTIPDGKLFYPEPFIASPSYLHSDLSYLHIFQYWYWLWFMFIFLICFFFISFVCTVRWCNNRVRPRRETRGVSRSKCGDLITACVPVSWAASIIVNESTDATDLNDGFGTAELVVGVRAYQWGWEYYYPRTIDLNYSVRPSYSAFVGNSLKYNFSSGKTLSSNMLWRMYQNKAEDRIVTPAHLLLLPLDSNGLVNYVNFKDVGLNTLNESSAFSAIRNATKIYNTNLVHTPTEFSSKYAYLNSAYVDENSFLTTSSFGVKKQHTSASMYALGNPSTTTILDTTSLNKFLSANMNVHQIVDSQANNYAQSPISLSRTGEQNSISGATRAMSLVQPNGSSVDLHEARLLTHPAFIEGINDNSDLAGLATPSAKLTAQNVNESILNNKASIFTQTSLEDPISYTTESSQLTRTNKSFSSKEFNLSGPNSKVLANDQSIRNFTGLTANKSNFNLTSGSNTVSSNKSFLSALNKPSTPALNASSNEAGNVDYVMFNTLASNRSLMTDSHPSVLSSHESESDSLGYDRGATYAAKSVTNRYGYSTLVETQKLNSNAVGDVFIGSREKTPQAINSAYWSTFWATSTPTHRVSSSLKAALETSNFYLPYFSTYADYDFRNDQAVDMLEELFWESNYSAYGFYDYMNMKKDETVTQAPSVKDFGLEKPFYSSNLGSDVSSRPLTSAVIKDLSSVGTHYSAGIQLEDTLLNPALMNTNAFSLLPTSTDMIDFDESFNNYKSWSTLLQKFSLNVIGTSTPGLAPRSYISVFNHFRSDYTDFEWFRSPVSVTPFELELVSHSLETLDGLNLNSVSVDTVGNDVRLSNPATLRPTIKNSIVNYNAFQKVFKPRFDESRAHVSSNSFGDLRLKQPLLSDSKVPYLQLLGKNRDSFFSTPLYYSTAHKNFNSASSLFDSLNTPMYDFPFLLSKTSDTARFTWIDWFSKWKHVEVQPSSVSKYSTLGVPYLRKPFDFNSTTGDKFQDTELYFTRVARSRRNYLTNWSYSPYLYNRTYVWTQLSNNQISALPCNASGSLAKYVLRGISQHPMHDSIVLASSTSTTVNFSLSGNDIFHKSTWRPRTSIASYYYNTSKLVDLLSKRELLCRQFLSNAYFIESLPSHLCATPSNPLLSELKASFLFSDPAQYSSEYSRDLFYSTSQYVKFAYLKTVAQSLTSSISQLPLNTSALTNYVFFYIFGSNSDNIGNSQTLLKDQFRPLKKGISSMLRLHATGAIAMPIEIRLQVLASSRDVIHSWAIPSASVKIDCVPGYTSHRMMKFLLTGVYWGQCQEICGRYHHWMPIVVYFMKRDLFFLWCTHFVFMPKANETWDIGDRKFADLIRFASYDKSSWLNEFNLSN